MGFWLLIFRGNILYDTINSLGLSILNTGQDIHLGKYNCPNSAIDISFSSPKLFWLSKWSVMNDPHGSDNFSIIISVNKNISTNFSHIFTSNLSNNSPLFKFNVSKADWNSLSQLIGFYISTISNLNFSIYAYNQFC